MVSFEPANLIKSVKPESLRVHAPSQIVFLCGGAMDAAGPPSMLRDAFYRLYRADPRPYKLTLAEDATPLTADAGYSDLFSFESDIAQLVGLILLFVESAGSIAELGAFAALPTVAPRLLAVIDEYFYDQVSFIRNGPIRFLENQYTDEWIISLERDHVGISADGRITNLNLPAFGNAVFPFVDKRLNLLDKGKKFNSANSGDVILLMVGLCQEYGALTKTEIREYLSYFNIDCARLPNFLYCAQLLSWIKMVRKGNHIFYVATPGEMALDYTLGRNGPPYGDKLRLRSEIRAYWKLKDGPRLRAIGEVLTSGMAPA